MRIAASVGSLMTVAFYLIAQMVGSGSLVKLMFGLPYETAVIAVGAIMIAYVLFGGMLAIYYGFILVLAFAKDVLAAKIGEGLTVGIPIGALVILSACVLTGIYVAWANGPYDRAVKKILEGMRGEGK